MNAEIGAEAMLFPEKEYISGIFVAVWHSRKANPSLSYFDCFNCKNQFLIHLTLKKNICDELIASGS
jgi:hypothetical protein